MMEVLIAVTLHEFRGLHWVFAYVNITALMSERYYVDASLAGNAVVP